MHQIELKEWDELVDEQDQSLTHVSLAVQVWPHALMKLLLVISPAEPIVNFALNVVLSVLPVVRSSVAHVVVR